MGFGTSFFSYLGHGFHIDEMGGETVGDFDSINTSPRVDTKPCRSSVGDDFRNQTLQRKEFNKMGDHFSILLSCFGLHVQEKFPCWCMCGNSSLHFLLSSVIENIF